MNILHATTDEKAGGASAAATRLHKALLSHGLDSHMAVLTRQGEVPQTALIGGKFSRRVVRPLVLKIEEKLLGLFYTRPDHPGYTTFSLTPSLNHSRLNALPKDILHLHWVGEGFLSPFSLARLHGPVVWTMHDTFAFTGGCHFTSTRCVRYLERCGKCPELDSSRENDLSRAHWLLKRSAVQKIRPVIVSPSKEYASRARQSGMLRDCRIETIPNGLDTNIFRPIPKEQARAILGLPQSGTLVLFGAVLATGDSNKGFDLLQEILGRLLSMGVDFSAVVFGSADQEPNIPCPSHFLGRLHDPVTLALAYSAADIFICPSRQENFPNTILEAMACGTPAAAFSVGGIPDLVEDAVTGTLAAPYDTAALAQSVGQIVQNGETAARMGEASRDKVLREYSFPVLAQRYAALYEDILRSSSDGVK